MNSLSSGSCPSKWLRWAWKVYLGIDTNNETNTSHDTGEQGREESLDHDGCVSSGRSAFMEREQILRRDSNYMAWQNCPWRTHPVMRRLIDPRLDMPNGLDHEGAPRIIVATNMADPLHDEGLELVQCLQEHHAKVSSVDAFGSHFVGYLLDAKSDQLLRDLWSEALWGTVISTVDTDPSVQEEEMC